MTMVCIMGSSTCGVARYYRIVHLPSGEERRGLVCARHDVSQGVAALMKWKRLDRAAAFALSRQILAADQKED